MTEKSKLPPSAHEKTLYYKVHHLNDKVDEMRVAQEVLSKNVEIHLAQTSGIAEIIKNYQQARGALRYVGKTIIFFAAVVGSVKVLATWGKDAGDFFVSLLKATFR